MKKYFIENTKKHATACVITDHPTVTDKLIKKNAVFAGLVSTHDCRRTYADKFVGVTRCHKLDTPDSEIGRNIASSKADLAYHKAMARDLKDIKRQVIKEFATLKALEAHELKMIDKTSAFLELLKQ